MEICVFFVLLSIQRLGEGLYIFYFLFLSAPHIYFDGSGCLRDKGVNLDSASETKPPICEREKLLIFKMRQNRRP